MKKMNPLACVLVLGCSLLSGCAALKQETPSSVYDLGPLRPAQTLPRLPALAIAEVNGPAWLDGPMMYFRLAYANDQQPRPYATTRWIMPPTQLFGQRVKSRIAQAGGVVISASDGAVNVLLLRIEADDFMQIFTAPGQSLAQVIVRATVFDGRTMVAQKSFSQQLPTSTADGYGGAKALALASDAVISDMLQWLAGLHVKK